MIRRLACLFRKISIRDIEKRETFICIFYEKLFKLFKNTLFHVYKIPNENYIKIDQCDHFDSSSVKY